MSGGRVIPFDRGRLRDEVRQALSDPWRVCELLGLMEGHKREASGVLIRCPSHAEKVPSCSVTQGPDGTVRARCFACQFSGDVFSLVAVVKGLDARRDFVAVLEHAADLAGVSTRTAPASQERRSEARAVAKPEQPEDLSLVWDMMPSLSSDAWEYLKSRGLEEASSFCHGLGGGDERAQQLELAGYAIALPLRDVDGRIVAVQVRSLAEKAKDGADQRFRAIGPTSVGVFGDPLAVADAKNVIVAEGMTDTLAALLAVRDAKVTAAVGVAGVKATAGLLALPLKGKRVLVATDADSAGDDAAELLAEQLTRIGARPIRARPKPDGADLASMRRAGVDLVAFFREALATESGFRDAATHLAGERQERQALAGRVLPFGVRFLDVALGGLLPTDLLLIGGDTGKGKTELARIIAQTNASAGKRVHFFALEAEQREIERRAKYAIIAQRIYAELGAGPSYERMNYLDWHLGRLDDLTAPYEDDAEQQVVEQMRNFYTFYRPADFGLDDYDRAFSSIADETDIVVLDHFHFIDFGAENENHAAKLAAKRIRQLALDAKKPVILMAHIRKANRQGPKRLIPTLDDFHGSSDLIKVATKAVLLAPAYNRENRAPHLWNTYLAIGKCRIDGSRARYAACVEFNARSQRYENDFQLGTVSIGGDRFTDVKPDKLPAWAKLAEHQEQIHWSDQ